jgi:hypothetical protein
MQPISFLDKTNKKLSPKKRYVPVTKEFLFTVATKTATIYHLIQAVLPP